jgi:hypothetical protein
MEIYPKSDNPSTRQLPIPWGGNKLDVSIFVCVDEDSLFADINHPHREMNLGHEGGMPYYSLSPLFYPVNYNQFAFRDLPDDMKQRKCFDLPKPPCNR